VTPDAEELLQGPGAHPERDVEHAVVGEQAVGNNRPDQQRYGVAKVGWLKIAADEPADVSVLSKSLVQAGDIPVWQ
jgi:hypothetical protein